MNSRRLLPVLTVLLLLMPACGKDSTPSSQPPTVVQVRDAAGTVPVADVKIVIMDATANLPLAAPLRSDDDGVCDFGHLPGTGHMVMVFGGGSWRPFGVTETVVADVDPGLMTPATASHSTLLLTRVTPIPRPGASHISGNMIDADTGAPLDQVFVAVTPYPIGYLGQTGPSDDVTLADGAFRVSEIIFAQEPITGRPVQVLPLFITRHGYLPRVWLYQARPGENIVEITGVQIALQRDRSAARGGLRGRLLRLGEPVADLVVGIGIASLPSTKGAAGLTGFTAVTNTAGVFVFEDLPADRYILHPAHLPGDHAFYPDQDANFPREVVAGEELDAGDFLLVWEMDPLLPRSGSQVSDLMREFIWEPVPGAATYEFFLDGPGAVVVAEPTYVLPGTQPLAGGNHWWSVIARDAQGAAVGTFGQEAEFFVVEGAQSGR